MLIYGPEFICVQLLFLLVFGGCEPPGTGILETVGIVFIGSFF